MVILDATRDPLFEHNPLVTGAPHIRFYAGAPLVTPDGFRLGSLCVIDQRPREHFPDADRALLTDLAQSVVSELELRFTQRTLIQEAQANARLLRSVQDAQTLGGAAGRQSVDDAGPPGRGDRVVRPADDRAECRGGLRGAAAARRPHDGPDAMDGRRGR